MPKLDWQRFLRQRNVEFVTKGPNTARDHISIRCPWCGDADPSQHLGISLKGRGWGCFRNRAHRGKSAARLIQKLLGCSFEEAKRLSGVEASQTPTVDALAASYALLKGTRTLNSRSRRLTLPPEFKPLLSGSRFAEPFRDYLTERGYRASQIRWLAENYDLRYCIKGAFAYRIIIPIRGRYGELLSWTARAIEPDAIPRYKTLRVTPDERDPTQPVAIIPSNETLLGLPVLWNASNPNTLVLVEGPFDALKLTAFGHSMGLYGASLFGLNVYPSQITEILALSERFQRVCLLLDEDAELHRLRLLSELSVVNPVVLKMPEGSDDPGAMSGSAVVNLAMRVMG